VLHSVIRFLEFPDHQEGNVRSLRVEDERAYCLTNPARKRAAAKEFSIKLGPIYLRRVFFGLKREIRTSFAPHHQVFLRDQRRGRRLDL
jgi:hypothetical protein